MNSITRRWVRGSLLFTILLLLVVEAVFAYFSITSTYEDAKRSMQHRLENITTQLQATDTQTSENRGLALRRMVEEFDEKDKFEFMLLEATGTVATSTTGYIANQSSIPADFSAAKASDDGTGQARYTTPAGERVMAVTYLLEAPAKEIVAVRLVTSLSLVNQQLFNILALSAGIVVVIILFTALSGVYFIRSIVVPIAEIEETTAKIAKGDLGIRIDNRYNDEIGSLAQTINHMAGELDKSERMKNEFISSVSHELRTPLTSIKGWVETIGNIKNPSDANFQRGVQVIASETDRLYDMVEELLDFSRIQNGITLQTQLVDLVAEVGDAVLMATPRAAEAGVAMGFDENELPVPVMADTARLRQVLINLLDNAVKYTPKGKKITVSAFADENTAYLRIADEGSGIAPEDLNNVKTKFYKGKNAVRGSGIGLAVADEIVRAHGGTLSLASTLGKGTMVNICLPLYNKDTH